MHWNQILQITLFSKLKKNYLTGKMSKGITNFHIETALKKLTMKIEMTILLMFFQQMK